MRGVHQLLFSDHLLQPTQAESIQASGALDLTEHRLHDCLAQGLHRLIGLGRELPVKRNRLLFKKPTAGAHVAVGHCRWYSLSD